MPPSRSPTPTVDSMMDTSNDAPTTSPPPDKHTLQLLHNSWHIPYLSHFTWLFQKQLALKPLPPAELELALYNHNTSPVFHNLLTRLLIGSVERAKLSKNEYWSYDMLCELVELQYKFWFETLLSDSRRRAGSDSDASDSDTSDIRDTKENSLGTASNPYDITKYEAREEAKYAHTVRQLFHYSNPLEHQNFSDLAVDVKAAVLYSLADYYVCTGKEFVSHIRSLEASDQRIEPLGYDTDGNRYWYMGFIDWRIYRSTTPTLQIGQHDADAAAAAAQRRSQPNTPNKLQQNGHSKLPPSNLVRSASAAGAEEVPRFELITSSSTELRTLINKLTKVLNSQNPHKLHFEKLVENLEQVYTNLSEGKGHAVEAQKDESTVKARKKQVIDIPSRGSARLEHLAVQLQAKQAEQLQDMQQKRTRRSAQVNHRAQEYKEEMLSYLVELAKLISKQASSGEAADDDSVGADD